MTVTQPEWDAEDRAVVQALLDLQSDTCDGCGQRLSVSLHQEGVPDPEWENHFLVCTGCYARELAMQKRRKLDEAVEKSDGFVAQSSRKFITRLKPKAPERR